MVKEHECLHPSAERDVDGVLDAAVTPTCLRGQLSAGVLGVVNEHVGARQEGGVALIARVCEVLRIEEPDRPVAPPRWACVRLMIRRVDERRCAGGDAIGHRRRGVVHELRAELQSPDGELGLAQLDEVETRRQRGQRDREVRVIHGAADGLRQRPVDTCRSVDRELAAGRERRQEEGQPLDVVAVRV